MRSLRRVCRFGTSSIVLRMNSCASCRNGEGRARALPRAPHRHVPAVRLHRALGDVQAQPRALLCIVQSREGREEVCLLVQRHAFALIGYLQLQCNCGALAYMPPWRLGQKPAEAELRPGSCVFTGSIVLGRRTLSFCQIVVFIIGFVVVLLFFSCF